MGNPLPWSIGLRSCRRFFVATGAGVPQQAAPSVPTASAPQQAPQQVPPTVPQPQTVPVPQPQTVAPQAISKGEGKVLDVKENGPGRVFSMGSRWIKNLTHDSGKAVFPLTIF